jgi:drug/metabolite transporter (DMT)-like permease
VLRHEFQPGRLVAGLFLALAGVVYAGDAGGLWDTPWFALIPVVVGGLCLAGAVAVLTRGVRRRRRAADRTPADRPPADTGAGAPS